MQDLFDKARSFSGLDDGTRGKGTHPYFAPSDEPLSWNTKGQMVTLDAAIYALHVYCMRVAFRSFASTLRQKLVGIGQAFEGWVAQKVALKFLSQAANKFLDTVKQIQTFVVEEDTQKGIEQAIRRQSVKVQRELKELYLGKGKPRKRRRTKTVWSRHFTPYQRIKPRKK